MARIISECTDTGNVRAWLELIAEIQPVIANTAIKTIRHFGTPYTDVVDDLIQETFVRILEKNALAAFRSETSGSIFGYVQKITSSVVCDHYRASNARKRGGDLRLVALDGGTPGQSGGKIEQQVLIGQVMDILKKIAPLARDQAIYQYHHFQGMTAKEIASIPIIGLSTDGVESVIHRIKKEIQKEIAGVTRTAALMEKAQGARNRPSKGGNVGT